MSVHSSSHIISFIYPCDGNHISILILVLSSSLSLHCSFISWVPWEFGHSHIVILHMEGSEYQLDTHRPSLSSWPSRTHSPSYPSPSICWALRSHKTLVRKAATVEVLLGPQGSYLSIFSKAASGSQQSMMGIFWKCKWFQTSGLRYGPFYKVMR